MDRTERAFVALVSASDRFNRRLARFMREWGLTVPQYNVLRILRGAGPEGRPSRSIADDMISQVPDVTRLVDRLVAAGFAERRTDPDDGRVVRVQITAEGRDLLARMDEPVAGLHGAVLGDLAPAELDGLVGMLERIR